MNDTQQERQPQRWDTSRVEASSDGVFAIAITLLVLDIKVNPSDFDHLVHATGAPVARVPGVHHEFLTVEGVWIVHHELFTRLRFIDPVLPRIKWATEGDRAIMGDYLSLGDLSDTCNGLPHESDAALPANNFSNSSISSGGMSVGGRTPDYDNQLSFDLGTLNLPEGTIHNGATGARLARRRPFADPDGRRDRAADDRERDLAAEHRHCVGRTA